MRQMRHPKYGAALGTVMLLGATLFLVPQAAQSRQAQSELTQQAFQEWQKADVELNTVYNRLQSTLDKTGTVKLKKAQRAWIAFRDADAEFSADEMRGGSAEPMLRNGALARRTEERTQQLRTYLNRQPRR